MSYLDKFELSFIENTLEILRNYDGKYDASISINCLLGLLIVPKEKFLKSLPDSPLSDLGSWGINPKSIKNPGESCPGNKSPDTIRGFVINLRHAVAHFNLIPVPRDQNVHSFSFKNKYKFEAIILLTELRAFVYNLADYINKHA